MKFLYKWLGIYQLEDKIARLKQMNRDDLETITELSIKYNNLLEIKNLVELERDSYKKELNTALSSKSTLTAEVIKLREQLEEYKSKVETLEQSNSEYLSVNEDLIKENKKLNNIKEQLMDAVTDLVNIVNADYD